MDTNIALWCLAAPERLSPAARLLLEDPEQAVAFSSISIVEFELKRERLRQPFPDLGEAFAQQLAAQGFEALAFSARDAAGLSAVTPNRDPFDRMLGAQAIARGLTLITADRELLAYRPLDTLW